MNEQHITMEDEPEISDAVRMLADRMESNPEDFVDVSHMFDSSGSIYRSTSPRFARVYDHVMRVLEGPIEGKLRPGNGLWFLNEAEMALLTEAMRTMMRRLFEAKVFETLYAKREEVPNVATYTQAATLDASGNLGIGAAIQSAIATGTGIYSAAHTNQIANTATANSITGYSNLQQEYAKYQQEMAKELAAKQYYLAAQNQGMK